MKRRIEALSSTAKAVRRRNWKEDSGDEKRAASSDSEERKKAEAKVKQTEGKAKAKPAVPPRRAPMDSDDELDMALDAALEEEAPLPTEGGLNPVVWMDLSVAGQPRGRVHFELFRDVVPKTADNFRRLCIGVEIDGRLVGYRGSEIHKVLPGRSFEGGEFDTSATGKDFEDESFKLTHSSAGLLSMCGAGRDANASRFQVVLRPSPEFDNKHVVFGQVLPYGPECEVGGDHLHVLHWVEAMGTSKTGTPREAIVIEACGELPSVEAAKALGLAKLPENEPQSQKYMRGGLRPPKLSDAVQASNLADVLELTANCLDSWEWESTKAKRSSDKDRAQEIEIALRLLGKVLEEAKYKAGSVQGARGVHGRNAQSQQLRLREIQETLENFF